MDFEMIEVQRVCDQIYDILLKEKPKVPEIGWVELEDKIPVFRARFDSFGHDIAVRVMETSDPRYELNYLKARLLREKPWPLEIRDRPVLAMLLTLYRARMAGVEEVTLAALAEGSGYAISTVKVGIGLICPEYAKRLEGNRFQLLLPEDRELWVRKGSCLKFSHYRLTTLAREYAAGVPVQKVIDSSRSSVNTREIIEGTLVTLLTMRLQHASAIQWHTQALQTIRQQEEDLHRLLKDVIGEKDESS